MVDCARKAKGQNRTQRTGTSWWSGRGLYLAFFDKYSGRRFDHSQLLSRSNVPFIGVFFRAV